MAQNLTASPGKDELAAMLARSVPLNSPTIGDYAKSLASGVGGVVSALGEGVKQGSQILGTQEGQSIGEGIRGIGDDTSDYWNNQLTPGGKFALSAPVIRDDLSLGPTPLSTAALSAAQSVPGMAAMAIPGAKATRALEGAGAGAAIEKGLGKLGVSAERAKWVGEKAPSALGMGASEGVFSGLQNAAQTAQEIDQLPLDKLQASPFYQSAYNATDPTLSPQERHKLALDPIKDRAEKEIIARTTLMTGGISAATGGGVLGQMVRDARKSVIKEILSGMGSEAAQEFAQSGEEQIVQNLAMQNYVDPSQGAFDGALNAAVAGGMAGGMLGGMGGGVHGLTSAHDQAQPPEAQSEAQSESPVAPDGTQPTGPGDGPGIAAQPTAEPYQYKNIPGVRPAVTGEVLPPAGPLSRAVNTAAALSAPPAIPQLGIAYGGPEMQTAAPSTPALPGPVVEQRGTRAPAWTAPKEEANGAAGQKITEVAQGGSRSGGNPPATSISDVLAQPAISGVESSSAGTVAGGRENPPAATAVAGGHSAVAQPATTLETQAGQQQNATMPKLSSDIPSAWRLKENQDYTAEKGKDEYGVYRHMGKMTGSFDSNVTVPLSVLTTLKGQRGEQSNVRKDSLDHLVNAMRNGEDVGAPYIEVDQDGYPTVSEGNHRIMAAAKLGWKDMPVEIRYFNGGELADGPLNPSRITNPATPLPEQGAPGAEIQPAAQPVAPAAPNKKSNQKFNGDLINDIKQLGGVSSTELKDITGESSVSKVRGAAFVFRKDGHRLDNLVTRLNEIGYNIKANDVDGGVQQLRDMLRDALDGNAVRTPEAQERAQRAADAKEHRANIVEQAKSRGISTVAKRVDQLEAELRALDARDAELAAQQDTENEAAFDALDAILDASDGISSNHMTDADIDAMFGLGEINEQKRNETQNAADQVQVGENVTGAAGDIQGAHGDQTQEAQADAGTGDFSLAGQTEAEIAADASKPAPAFVPPAEGFGLTQPVEPESIREAKGKAKTGDMFSQQSVSEKFTDIDAHDEATKQDMLQHVAGRTRSDAELSAVLDRLPDPLSNEPYTGNTSRIAWAALNNPAASTETKKRAQKIYDDSTRPASKQSAIESIKQSDIPTADKIRLAQEVKDGKVAPESVADIVGDVSPNQENVSTSEKRVDAHDKLFDRVREGDITADEFKAAFANLLKNKEGITAELSALTKDRIFKQFPGLEYRHKNEKKADLVKAAYSSMLDDFVLGNSISYPFGQKYEDVIQGYVDRTTDESIKQYAEQVRQAKAEREQRKQENLAGTENPQTADDFKRLLSVRAKEIGEGATFQQARMTLTPEQRAKFDELEASRTRDDRKARADQQKTEVHVAAQTTEGQIVETKHTKTGVPLFGVKAAERVERDVYNQWNATAKRLGGWYSSFRGNGAVPGFQFKTRENADAFLKYLGGDTAQAQEAVQTRRDAFADDKSQSAVERLTEMADKLEEKADASLNQERKANTQRRAMFAASAEAAANYDKAMAQTMRNIANAIQNGTAKFLDRVRQKVQVEMLSGFVRTAQDEMQRKLYPSYAEQEKHKGEKPTQEVADYAAFPNYTAFRSDLASLGRALLETDGTKKLGQRLMKVADDVSDAYLKFAKENLHKVSAFGRHGGGLAEFASKQDAEAAIARSGYKGSAIVLPFKRGQNIIILSPSEAIKRGVWEGDNDKRITLTGDFGVELVEAIGKASRRGAKVSVPWQFENTYDKRKHLAAMGIETPAELRAALREFIGLKEAPKEADKIKEMERSMIGRRNDGLDFFPTPSATADEMVEAAGIKEGMSVLEPSAGMGHIAERIREAGVEPDVVELSNDRNELLEAKGFNVVGRDFMEVDGDHYDRIIMNPPFSDGRAAQHVQHAYDMLKPGGRLVALVDEGVFFRGDKKAQAFREWLERVGATDEKLAEGTFNDPSLPVNTGVNARMLVIDKAEGVALLSRTRPSAETGAFSSRKLENPSAEIESDVEQLRLQIGNEYIRSGIPQTGWTLEAYSVPDAARGIVSAVKRLFGVDVRFVRTNGIDPRLQFDGIYIGRNTVYVNVDSGTPFSSVIGHEFLHYLRHSSPNLFNQFADSAAKLFSSNARSFIKARSSEYRARGHNQPDAAMLGHEELLADAFGDAWGDPEFWKSMAARNLNIAQRALLKFKVFLNRIVNAIRAEKSAPETQNLFTDFDAVKKLVLNTSASYAESGFSPYTGRAHTRWMVAWHGSPHDHNGFDSSKIGTGEGAQAYGWGHYFASAREVAEHYQMALSNPAGVHVKKGYGNNSRSWFLVTARNDLAGGPFNTKRDAEALVHKGRLYQVELAPSEDEYLDWDKPLSKQSDKVKAALEAMGVNAKGKTGEEIYRELAGGNIKGHNAKMSSQWLHDAGIRGIRYLDGSSRSAGEGNHNYVIFDDKDVSITAKFSRRIHGDRHTVNDYIVPETPEFDGNMSGNLGAIPESAAKNGVEHLPIRLTVGVARGAHSGFGVHHIADNESRFTGRETPQYTDDKAENIARHVALLARSFNQVYSDSGRVIARSERLKEALVLEKRKDALTGESFYAVTTIRPAEKNVWGNPVWVGRLTFPTNEPRQPGASTLTDGNESSQPSRNGQRNQTEHFDLNEGGQKKQPSITNKKKRRVYTMQSVAGTDIGGSGMSSAAVEAIIAPTITKWKHGNIQVVQSVSDLPTGLQREIYSAGAEGDMEGVYHGNGKVYLVADHLPNAKRVMEVLAHEAIGHLAAEELTDQADYQRAINSVQTLERMGNKTIRALGEAVDDRQPGLSAKSRAKEIMALAVENGSYKNVPLLQKAVAAITSWVKAKLRAMGLNWKWVNSMGEQEVYAMLRDAERRLEGTPSIKRDMMGVNAAMASRSDANYDYAKAGLQLLAHLDGPDGLFQYKKVGKDAKTLAAVAKEIEPGLRVEDYDTRKIPAGKAEKAWEVRMPDGNKAYVYEKNGRVWINASGLDSGVSKGTLLYALVGNYAYNTDKVFIGDPDGLSIKALIRRTENMASLAIKFGTTRFLYPHAAQIDPRGYYGGRNDVVNGNAAVAKEIQPIKWSDTNDDENMRSLLQAAYRNAVTLVPEIKNVSYDFDTGRFVASDGNLVDEERFRSMSKRAAADLEQRGLGAGAVRVKNADGVESTRNLAGSATLKRAALIGTMVRSGRSDESWGRLLDQIGRQLSGDGLDPALRETFYSRSSILGASGRDYTPEQRAAMERTGSVVTHKTIKETVASLWQDAGKKLAQGIVDQFRPVRDISARAYTLMRLSKGATGAFEAFMHHGKISLRDGAYDADTSGGVLDKVFYPLGKESTDFLRWVAGNRAERLATEGKENLFSPEDIAAFKSLATGKADFDYTLPGGKTTRDRAVIYRDSLRKFNEFNKNVLDMAEQSGLIDPESRRYWEHEFYVPFYRMADDKDGGVRGMNIKQGVIRQEAFKKLKGGEDKLNDLLANTLMNWAHLIDASAKNRAAVATLDAAVKVGAAREALPGEKNTVWAMRGGQKVEYKVEDPYLLSAISSLEYAGLRGPAMDAMSTVKHWLTVGVTASPFFKVRNLIRDSVQAIATGDLGYNPIENVMRGYKLTDRASQEYVSALAGGGLIRFGTMLEGSEASRARQLIKQGASDEHILDDENKVRAFYDKYLEPAISTYNELGNRGEEINRMALYDRLIKKGFDHATASLMARDLMDFSMQGTWGSVRFLTQIVPFMNARLQGLYKLGRAANEDKQRFAIVLGGVTLASLALLAAYGDDDDWKKREEWDRNNYWWFKFGGMAFRIPKPFEIGAVATLTERSAELIFDKEMTGKRFRDQVLQITGDQLAMNPTPQLFKPVVDLYANKDSFTGRPIETMGMERLAPEYRFNQGTSMVARGISTASMGTVSPVQVDHVVRSYFGWLGATTVSAADMLVRGISNEPTRPAIDFWKTATGNMASGLSGERSRYVSQMYEQARELEQAYGTWHNLVKERKLAEAAEYRADHKDELARYRRVEHVKRQMSKLNEQVRVIERSAFDADTKRERINALRQRQDTLARQLTPG